MSVHVIGSGARTPLGLNASASAAAVRAGISRVREHPLLVDHTGEFIRGAFDSKLEARLPARARVVALATSAVAEFLSQLGRPLPGELKLLLALPEVRPGWTNDDVEFVLQSVRTNAQPWTLSPVVCGRGHAGSLRALDVARQLVASGQEQLVLVGGADTYFETSTLSWLADNRQLASDDVRSGTFPGEACGVVGIVSASLARQLRLPTCVLIGSGISQEPRTRAGGEEVLGEGLSKAVLDATNELRADKRLVAETYCDLNGERYRADEWAFTVLRTSFCFTDPTGSLTAPADLWGDVGAASGVLHAILAMAAWERG